MERRSQSAASCGACNAHAAINREFGNTAVQRSQRGGRSRARFERPCGSPQPYRASVVKYRMRPRSGATVVRYGAWRKSRAIGPRSVVADENQNHASARWQVTKWAPPRSRRSVFEWSRAMISHLQNGKVVGVRLADIEVTRLPSIRGRDRVDIAVPTAAAAQQSVRLSCRIGHLALRHELAGS